ncbi:undecaprenyl-diphosphate phosphatase [Paenibacillus lycopersici]|uniref:Undecaprenyl-diphosphatase n=1 Tax=Paenibacillus lycopersici TaxID=2704462 RepID=A0A6C0FW85_9BACL|nr:undecaprenyl-diphosphate phosphatase [Paenibacillus lycopersici]QHT61386.1 undecaprenyl-diphosphate phosphatase [Paenibacillus lycopersici]
MSNIVTSVIQGIVEGLTEFLPVSSTGHLILTGKLLGFTGEKADTFEIVIQLGAILAVAIVYWRRILSLLGLGGPGPGPGSGEDAPEAAEGKAARKLNVLHVILACLPAMALGLILHGFIKSYLFSPYTVLAGLVLGGLFMLLGQKKQAAVQAEDIDQLSYKQALLIGLFQCLALWPGFSRSGATIAGGLLAGVGYRAATNFSFLVAIPMMIAASGYELLKSHGTLTASDAGFFATGFIVAFVVALLAVLTFLKLLEKLKLAPFAYYRFVLAAVFLAYLLLSA